MHARTHGVVENPDVKDLAIVHAGVKLSGITKTSGTDQWRQISLIAM
jgi:hypothetical protein